MLNHIILYREKTGIGKDYSYLPVVLGFFKISEFLDLRQRSATTEEDGRAKDQKIPDFVSVGQCRMFFPLLMLV